MYITDQRKVQTTIYHQIIGHIKHSYYRMKNGEEIQAFLIDIQEQKTFDQEYLIVLFSNVSVIFKEKHECTLLSEHLLQSKRTCSESLVCDIVRTKR